MRRLAIISSIVLILPLVVWSYVSQYSQTLVTSKGETFQMVPMQDTETDLKGYISILTDPDTTSTMRDLKPWPVPMVKSTFDYYIASWTAFEDLKKAGLKPPVMGVCFLIHTKDGKVIASGGVQRSTRGEGPAEIYFVILPPYRNKGLGTVFAQAIMKFSETQFGRQVMEAIVRPTNTPSKKLLAKLGFSPVLEKGKPVIHNFPQWNNTEYAVYKYTPSKK